MTPGQAALFLTEHLLVRRGESSVYIAEWELTEAIRMAVQALHNQAAEARILTDARRQLMASRQET